MLKLNAAFNKKIPVAGEQYSSQSYHCSVEVELSDAASPEQLQAKIAETFALVRDAVESELHGKPSAKAEPAAPARNNGNADNQPWKCSDKQRALIVKIVDEGKLDRAEVEQLAVNRFGHGVALLNKLEASGLIDELLGKTGREGSRKDGVVRSFQQRRAA